MATTPGSGMSTLRGPAGTPPLNLARKQLADDLFLRNDGVSLYKLGAVRSSTHTVDILHKSRCFPVWVDTYDPRID